MTHCTMNRSSTTELHLTPQISVKSYSKLWLWIHQNKVTNIRTSGHALVVNSMEEGRKEMVYLTMHSTHFIYGYMASDILWLRTILIVRKETCCCHIGYSFWLAARVLLYAPSHRQDSTYHRQDSTYYSLCYTSRGALAGTRNSSMGSPHEGSIRRPIAPWANALTTELHVAPVSLNKAFPSLLLCNTKITNCTICISILFVMIEHELLHSTAGDVIVVGVSCYKLVFNPGNCMWHDPSIDSYL